MSIAEKLPTIAENTPKVYEKGYEDGKNSVIPFERYVKTIQIVSLNVFDKSEAVINLDSCTDLSYFCNITKQENINTTVEHLTINCPNQVTQLRELLYCSAACADKTLKRLTLNVDTQKAATLWNCFTNLQALEIIDGEPINCSSMTNLTAFNGATALKEIRFIEGTIKVYMQIQQCSNLSTETIQSIIDGLADLTGGTAQTLTVHADVGAKLTDEQKTTITAKNWTLVY